MFNINTSRVKKLERLFCSSRVSGLSSKRSGLQAFTLKIRVRIPLTLFLWILALFSRVLAFATDPAPEIAATAINSESSGSAGVPPASKIAASLFNAGSAGASPASKIISWCCGLVVKDNALSARGAGVQIPSAPPWERSSNGKTAVCEIAYTGSIPVLSPISNLSVLEIGRGMPCMPDYPSLIESQHDL